MRGQPPAAVLAVGLLLLVAGIYGGLFITPPDYLQGETVRILYIHVPAAWLGMAGWAAIAAASISQLVWRHRWRRQLAASIAPAGATFAALCLTTGSIWGRPTGNLVGMGRPPDLDVDVVLPLPRLHCAASAERERGGEGRMAALFGVVGAINLPIIHYSVMWWRTLHQGQSISIAEGSAIAPELPGRCRSPCSVSPPFSQRSR